MALIGSKLRELRRRRDLALRELALRSGISHSTISLVERDMISPSIDTLLALLDVLGTTMASFFSDLDRRGEKSPFYARDDFVEIGNTESISYRMLGVNQDDRQMLMLWETYQPGSKTSAGLSHLAQEAGIVTSGAIELTVDGETKILREGEGYYFDSRLPHCFANATDEVSHIVSAVTPPTY